MVKNKIVKNKFYKWKYEDVEEKHLYLITKVLDNGDNTYQVWAEDIVEDRKCYAGKMSPEEYIEVKPEFRNNAGVKGKNR